MTAQQREVTSVVRDAAAATQAGPTAGRSAGVGFMSGALGGLCCIGSAVAVGAGIAGLSFFTTWMERYQLYFIAASVLIMLVWLWRTARTYGFSRFGLGAMIRGLRRRMVVMGVTYAVTLGIAFGISFAVRMA